MLPRDPVMLLSYVNTQLRDFYPDLKSFCAAQNIDPKTLKAALQQIDYEYDPGTNRFV